MYQIHHNYTKQYDTKQDSFRYEFCCFYHIFTRKMEQGTKCVPCSVLFTVFNSQMDLVAAELNRLQQRDIDKLITIAAISSVAKIEH